jgi:hypothetical protein
MDFITTEPLLVTYLSCARYLKNIMNITLNCTSYTYTDFKQAFETVNRHIMLQRLQETGIPNKLIRLVKMTIQYTWASVAVENLKTDPFDILTGVWQDDPLFATLFNLVRELVIKKLELRSDISAKLTQINAYADDIALI